MVFSAENSVPIQHLVIFCTESDGGPRSPRRADVLEHHGLTERVIGKAIEVHRTIGPGLLESVYEACLCQEFKRAGIRFRRQVSIPVVYKGTAIPLGFRADILVADAVILEIKGVVAFIPAHHAQILHIPPHERYPRGPDFEFSCTAVERRTVALCRLTHSRPP